MNSLFPGTQLVILEHTSQAEEKYVKNGESKNVHVVVKNTPFHIKVGLNKYLPDAASNVDFNVVTLEAHLMYDCDGDRFVDYVRNKPIEYKGTMTEDASIMTLEIRLKKLSSHLEDMFFKLRINAVDNFSKEPIHSLSVTTQPIKVVSKPEQVARIKEGQTGKTPAPLKRTKKRSLNELMYETMQKIEKQQTEQQAILQQLCLTRAPPPVEENKAKKQKTTEPSTLEGALQQLIIAYQNTDPNERPMKIRKLIRSSSTRDINSLSELTNHLQYSMQKDETFTDPFLPKQEKDNISVNDLQRIDDFYRDFLFSNPSNPNLPW